ncbi:MAG: segregation/condensation protein A [Neisseriaceae bacterium]|nr:MAG: segregation/condensation protein A [Neisseriaceae bacterium]
MCWLWFEYDCNCKFCHATGSKCIGMGCEMSHDRPVAILYGRPVLETPKDLFIPSNALYVILAEFEGPLDLLLYLIKKQNLDILNIPITLITKQYLQYIDGLKYMDFELASEYLLMASMLLDIKSRMMLPKSVFQDEIEEEEDPRNELARKLIEYEIIKSASVKLDNLLHAGRDFIWVHSPVEKKVFHRLPDVHMETLHMAWLRILNRRRNFQHHQIQRSKKVTVQEQSDFIMSYFDRIEQVDFKIIFLKLPNRQMMIVTFIALLTLVKKGILVIQQDRPLSPILIQKS